MFRSSWAIIREPMTILAKVTVLWKESQTARHTTHTTALNTFYDNIAEHITTYFYYFHKIVTLARIDIGSLMMVQLDRNM